MTAADTQVHTVDEFQCALKASGGDRKPSEAGIFMGKEKYMFVSHDAASGVAVLSKRGGGGAAICKTATALIIAIYIKDKPCGTAGHYQSSGVCAEQVLAMANYLKGEGF